MLVSDKDALARLHSPSNLLNRLKATSGSNGRKDAMGLFGINRANKEQPLVKSFNPFHKSNADVKDSDVPAEEPKQELQKVESAPVKIEDIMSDHEAKTKLALAHDQALDLLTKSTQMLVTKLDDVKPEKLPAVIAAASKTVESIRKERNESLKNNKDTEVHFHFYTPEQKKLTDYQVIDVPA